MTIRRRSRTEVDLVPSVCLLLSFFLSFFLMCFCSPLLPQLGLARFSSASSVVEPASLVENEANMSLLQKGLRDITADARGLLKDLHKNRTASLF